MTMTSGLRKLALTAHVISSIGWLGAVAGFLVLAVAGLTSEETGIVRAAYVAMELVTRFVIVPLCLASLVSGIVQSLGTPWGLFRHWWVVAKLVLTLIATAILLVHTRPIGYMAEVTAQTTLSGADFSKLRIQLVVTPAAGLLVLVITTVLGVYKPRGLTRYGWRKRRERRVATNENDTKRSIDVDDEH